MKTFLVLAVLGCASLSTAAAAHDTNVPYASRGQCESASAAQSNAEKDWVLATFPDLFDSTGQVASFLTRAWTCDQFVRRPILHRQPHRRGARQQLVPAAQSPIAPNAIRHA